ncbi:hypothetical protein PDIG_35720 [Penicillium digitatum PHI26]|uniref:Uncharacterized protein n=2 Tax=Penicillium digitatum TaxID=36651 RepID=K9FXW9_PEND2|nr:hypothetical protein PDIP_05750 [Penicillium digitatum Pd1]EKV13919.1 hypothetical protein PDIG_35720 [Penicillium digitatum PHI26]EKV21502.1 hypothetical protein PDIP_05750 [Penicillium digitatum Pd1]
MYVTSTRIGDTRVDDANADTCSNVIAGPFCPTLQGGPRPIIHHATMSTVLITHGEDPPGSAPCTSPLLFCVERISVMATRRGISNQGLKSCEGPGQNSGQIL